MNNSKNRFMEEKLTQIAMKKVWLFSIMMLLMGTLPVMAREGTGRVMGTVVDSESGEGLIGANIFFEGTSVGAATDLDGTFIITNAPVGERTLVVQMIGYAPLKIKGLKIAGDETKKLELIMKPEAFTTDEVVVEARMLRNNEATLLRERQKAAAVSDAISAEAISRSGSGNAAEAMTQVTGASVVDGKYVFIRGLGERYSSTMLNGAELPSADPEKKSVQMDLFPSNLLDNIVTLKTFTPDKPGNFSGGMVDIGTKSYPEEFMLKLSTGTSYNSLTTFDADYLTAYSGGSTDWLGMDDGTRAVPDNLKNDPDIPSRITAERDPQLAQELDQYSKEFQPQMAPVRRKAPMNQQYALSLGNQTTIFGRPLGYLASLTYKRDYSFYEDGKSERWQLGTGVATTDSLNPKILLSDSKGTDEVNWGGLGTLNYKFDKNHELNANVFYTQSGESSARYLAGPWPEQFGMGTNAVFETRVLKYTERNLRSYQLGGDHYFASLLGMKLEWKGSITNTTQDEPDTRYFSNHYSVRQYMGHDTTLYSIAPSNYSQPARYFRKLEENGRNFDLNIAFPFKQWSGNQGKLKFGGSYLDKNRTFDETRFQYVRPSNVRYDGDPTEFFSYDNVGIVGYDSTRNTYQFGNYIELSPDPRGGNYNGTEKIIASYGMIELPVMRDLRFIGGVRFEATRMEVSSADTTKPEELRTGKLDNNDWLPSANLVYQLFPGMNFRMAYGKTLARPTLREKAPYVNFEFANDYSFAGNVNLNRTLIDNFDVRWEWFERPGEIYAVSGFYKIFHQPIERTIVGASSADNPEITYQNVDRGRVFGVEFEIRKQMDQVYSALRNFAIGMNLTLVHSEVNIPLEKLEKLRERDPDQEYFKDDKRPLQGQSPYLFNLDFGYENNKIGTAANLSYNVFGKRLAEVTGDATPDVYEKSRSMLNFNFSQRVIHGLKIKFAAKNILDSSINFVHEYKGVEYVRKEYKIGRTFSLGLSYDMF